MTNPLDTQTLIDALGQAILIFDGSGKLTAFNHTARQLLGPDFRMVRSEGWTAAVALMNTRIADPNFTAEEVRTRALETGETQRFQMYRSGEYLPAWIAVQKGGRGELLTVVSVEQPDWTIVSDLLTFYMGEVFSGVDSTQGHAQLISRSLQLQKPGESLDKLIHRIGGFTRLIDIHMHRLGYLTGMMTRLENIRTGRIKEMMTGEMRKIDLLDFVGSFVEEIDESPLLDPESDLSSESHRARLNISIAPDIGIFASAPYVTRVLRDILRNAIMYSMKATPIHVRAHPNRRDHTVQIDVSDEGYGIRTSENERVFQPFARSRQPQIIGEFGYGLSLFLAKHEIEAMNGRMWFQSEEGVGTTVSIRLPMWRDDFALLGSSTDRS